MALVKVITGFYDLLEQEDRVAGDVFEATAERAHEIEERLPGFVEVSEEEAPAKAGGDKDYSKLSVKELRKLCAERGIEIPSNAKKTQLVEVLEG